MASQRPTRDIDPTELSRLLGSARPSSANIEIDDPELAAEIAEGTPPPTDIASLRWPERPTIDIATQRLPVSFVPPDRASFESIPIDPPLRASINSMVNQTLELPLGDLSLDEAEVQPLEEVRAKRAFLRIDTHQDVEEPVHGAITSPQLRPTKKRAPSINGTSVSANRRIPWLACGIALLASVAVTALVFAR